MSELPNMPPPRLASLRAIVEQGLCVGCGLCQSIAGVHRVRMRMNAEHGERPQVLESLDEATLIAINMACPGVHCEGVGTEPSDPDIAIDPLWGPTIWMGTGHATDEQVRFHASSGGALSALGIYLLDSGEVDFLLHVAASRAAPARSAAHLSFTAVDIMEASGSRYGPAAPLLDFKAVLDRGKPFAFIGKPCDISAIRNYAHLDPRVDELLRYTLNFFCGGVSEFRKTLDYLRKVGLSEPEVSHLRYRGDGCPGPMVMKSHDGRVFKFDYNEMWEDESRWQLQFRCKICPDSIGERADVTVADVWPGGKPDTEGLGFNGFIARTPRGARLLQAAVQARAITLTEDLDVDGLELAQGSHARRKQGLASRMRALRDAGLMVPRFERLRLDAADAMLDDAERLGNYAGMCERLRRGDHRETLPSDDL
ncbi:MAG: Coenzyme F420 hydrogenase/dehydrogenase, beta subunit C-terminal domain [Pseudomonadota bacterium]|nr:Coenzyme F420 hydrogenase/dehydrogenase, beta subunit C-terminal domain [Pseudomonadota bacterium]